MKSTRTLIGGVVAGTAGLAIFLIIQLSSFTSKGPRLSSRPAAAACNKGSTECLPKLTFVDTNGNAYPPEAIAGKVVVVNFWATWCAPCKSEIPAFSRVFERFKGKDVVMLGVMTNDPDPQTLLNFTSDHELLYPVVRADKEILDAFQWPEAIPTTFVFDRQGNRREAHRGPMTEGQLASQLDLLLAEK